MTFHTGLWKGFYFILQNDNFFLKIIIKIGCLLFSHMANLDMKATENDFTNWSSAAAVVTYLIHADLFRTNKLLSL